MESLGEQVSYLYDWTIRHVKCQVMIGLDSCENLPCSFESLSNISIDRKTVPRVTIREWLNVPISNLRINCSIDRTEGRISVKISCSEAIIILLFLGTAIVP